MPELTVRSIRRDELVQLLALYEQLHPHDPPLLVDRDIEALWDQIVADPRLFYFVGEMDGTLVSSCTLTIVPNLTRGARPYGLIENVITHVAYRKRGFGTRLLQHALGVAWDQGCYKVMLLTGRKDEGVFQFYEGAGFQRGIKTGLVAYPSKE